MSDITHLKLHIYYKTPDDSLVQIGQEGIHYSLSEILKKIPKISMTFALK